MRIFCNSALLLTLLLSVFALPSFAEDAVGEARDPVSVERDVKGTLLMKGASCELIQKQGVALSHWKEKLHEGTSSLESCQCKSQGDCSMSIDSVLPKFVAEIYGTKAEYGGPNCWNAVLVAGKFIPNLRFSTPEEMSFWMDSPLCREMESSEVLQPGDIMAIRHVGEGEVHGFVYVTDELTFSKNAYYRKDAYLLQNPDPIFTQYGAPEGCRKKESAKDPKCRNYVTYYRCGLLDDYLAARKNSISESFEISSKQLFNVECELSDLVFFGRGNPVLKEKKNQILLQAKNAMDVIAALATKEAARADLSEDERFLWKSLIVRADAVLHQIDFF